MTAMTAARRWRVTLDSGLTVAGDESGRPDAPVVVLLHGAASNLRWWDLVAAHLAVHHRVIRYDHRGHGRSTSPVGRYTVEDLAADAAAVIDRLGLGYVVLAGHSAGADVAARVAATRPDLVAALACVEGGVYDPRLLHGPTWPQARARMLTERRGHITLPVLQAWLHAAALPPETLPVLADNYTESSDGQLHLRLAPANEEQLARSLWTQQPFRLLGAVAVPVLAVVAQLGAERHDKPRRESIRLAREVLADRLAVRWIPGGHHLPLQEPVAVGDALAELTALAGSPV